MDGVGGMATCINDILHGAEDGAPPRAEVDTARGCTQHSSGQCADSSIQSVQQSRNSPASRATPSIHNLRRSLTGTTRRRVDKRGERHRARMIRAAGSFVFAHF